MKPAALVVLLLATISSPAKAQELAPEPQVPPPPAVQTKPSPTAAEMAEFQLTLGAGLGKLSPLDTHFAHISAGVGGPKTMDHFRAHVFLTYDRGETTAGPTSWAARIAAGPTLVVDSLRLGADLGVSYVALERITKSEALSKFMLSAGASLSFAFIKVEHTEVFAEVRADAAVRKQWFDAYSGTASLGVRF